MSLAPHFGQNFALAGICDPHTGQILYLLTVSVSDGSFLPHFGQYFAFIGINAPQYGHFLSLGFAFSTLIVPVVICAGNAC